ncbi:hypothetical protein FA13DRAFT_334137 [Coprinellus micaceus]|uniref:Uncharacterized protein n=1 Tax=Coprinellus micaceus TaxID=71717 RepID=A0A4Y7TDF0_COPMI|nr:hypothetical protein FA13DRAFT_334137 [Coprinellus micaceus]
MTQSRGHAHSLKASLVFDHPSMIPCSQCGVPNTVIYAPKNSFAHFISNPMSSAMTRTRVRFNSFAILTVLSSQGIYFGFGHQHVRRPISRIDPLHTLKPSQSISSQIDPNCVSRFVDTRKVSLPGNKHNNQTCDIDGNGLAVYLISDSLCPEA